MPHHDRRLPTRLALVPLPEGAVIAAEGVPARLLPWGVAGQLLDDPDLTVAVTGLADLRIREVERLLTALIAGNPPAGPWPLDAAQVQALPRRRRTWARTIDLGVLVGDVDAACCRAGLPLPGDDPLRRARAMADLLGASAGLIAVRQRLLDEHPWIGDQAWTSATGHLAEMVVLHGLRRDQVHRPPVAGGMPVGDLLAVTQRFQARRPDTRRAMDAILGGTVRWNDRGHLRLDPAGGFHHAVGGVDLAIGVGGLHSADPPGIVDGPLTDLDVASYYPTIIARDGLAPPQLPEFPARVGALLARRLAAKRAGDHIASQALKYVINSLYGQLGNARSGLCSPPDALRVVLTGQLHLLELIDCLLETGVTLVSANTDGVIIRGDPAAAIAWEARTGLGLERTAYHRLWRTSVNDYVAAAADGRIVKARGRFAGGEDAGAARHAAAPIIARAAVERLVHGRDPATVIGEAMTITDFTLWRHLNGLSWDGRPLTGAVVRWVVGRGGRPIVQSSAGRERSTVAARAVLVDDPAAIDSAVLDRAWYVAEAQAIIDRVAGTRQGSRQLSFLDPDDGV
jgi:hypothetical protein